MIFITGLLNLERIIGFGAYAFALISCAIAWVRGRRFRHQGGVALMLMVLEALLILDSIFKGRWLLHDSLARMAMTHHLYDGRSGPQRVALYLLGCAIVSVIGYALWLCRGRPGASLAVTGGILSCGFWWVEVISLHVIDSLLYRRVYGVMIARYVWAAFSLMTGVGILLDAFAEKAHNLSDKHSSL